MLELAHREYDLPDELWESLTGGQINQLWRCGPWVIKWYDTRRVPRQRVEHALHLQLACAEAGLPVPAPHRTRQGALWASDGGDIMAVLPFVTGIRRTRGTLSTGEADLLGTLVAHLHRTLGAQPPGSMTPPHRPDPIDAAEQWDSLRRRALSCLSPTRFDHLVVALADLAHQAQVRRPQAHGSISHGNSAMGTCTWTTCSSTIPGVCGPSSISTTPRRGGRRYRS